MFYVSGIYLLLFLTKQKHEVDGTVTNEPVSFIDVYQVKDKRGNYWLSFFDCIFLKAVCKVFNFFSFAIVFSNNLKVSFYILSLPGIQREDCNKTQNYEVHLKGKLRF